LLSRERNRKKRGVRELERVSCGRENREIKKKKKKRIPNGYISIYTDLDDQDQPILIVSNG